MCITIILISVSASVSVVHALLFQLPEMMVVTPYILDVLVLISARAQ